MSENMNQEIKIEDLEKVYIDLPNHWASSGESMWAKPLGDDLYEIHNTPFYAYGINFLDVVKVDSTDETQKPIVLEVVKPSGYRTLRVYFNESIEKESRIDLLKGLKNLGVDSERLDNRYVALDVSPQGDYDSVIKKLSEWEEEKVLSYETCENRIPNSFSDKPQEN